MTAPDSAPSSHPPTAAVCKELSLVDLFILDVTLFFHSVFYLSTSLPPVHSPNTMGLPPGDPLGKRGRPAYDDGEDDEEPVYIKKAAGLKKEANASTEKQAKATAEKEINASTKRVKIELHVYLTFNRV